MQNESVDLTLRVVQKRRQMFFAGSQPIEKRNDIHLQCRQASLECPVKAAEEA